MSNEEGSVYLAVNKSMPGLVKIGMTQSDVQSRMKELSADTGVPTPFTCPYSCEVQNPAIIEKQLHENFDYCRENDKREFFRTDWQAVRAALRLLGEKANVRLSESDNASSPKVGKFTVNKWAKEGNIENVRRALAEGGDPNQKDENKITALMWAAKLGHTDIVKILLDEKADPTRTDKDGQSALFEAENGVIAKMLLDKGASPNTTDRNYGVPLTHAVMKSRADVIEVLLNAEAVIESNSVLLTHAVRKNHGGIVRILLEHAVMKNRVDVLEMLSINANFKNVLETNAACLIRAISWGYVEVVRALLKYGGNPNAIDPDDNGTPLTCAIILAIPADKNSAGYQFVKMLLEYGASPNMIDSYGNSPLMYAVRDGHADIVKMLLDKGADSKPHLDNAIKKGDIKTVKILLEYGADSKPHLDNAIKKGNIKTVKILLENGADPKPHLGNAVKKGDVEIIKIFMSKGVNRDECLAFAAIGNDSSVVKELLATDTNATNACKIALQKYHIDESPWWVLQDNNDSWDAIVIKNRAENTENDHPDAVKLMLKNNADPWGCFTTIVDKNRADMVSVLLKHGLNPEDALEHATNVGHISVVKALLDNHAYSKLIMTNCLLLAAKEQRLNVVSMLIDSGANPNGGLKSTVTSVAIVELLIFKGADLDKAISCAVHSNHTDMVKALLYQGANPWAGLNIVKTYKVNADIKRMLRMRAFWRVFGR